MAKTILIGMGALLALLLAVLVGTEVWRNHRQRALPIALVSAANLARSASVPVSKLPGPPRDNPPWVFVLADTNSARMVGNDDPANERWCDIAGNFYSTEFASRFSYAKPGKTCPLVRVRIDPSGPTLSGRLEAHGLKPNFAYQVKLRGVFGDRPAFEAIGRAGRWRLPGRGTNYTDADYDSYPMKSWVEAYILFDFFTTDANGDVVRRLKLDSSLHVLFNATRQGGEVLGDDLVPVVIDARDARTYLKPKAQPTMEFLWAEREHCRYEVADDEISLPGGHYNAEIVLTEESFHSQCNDGGFWATVYRLPVSFTIVRPASEVGNVLPSETSAPAGDKIEVTDGLGRIR